MGLYMGVWSRLATGLDVGVCSGWGAVGRGREVEGLSELAQRG